MEIPDKVREAPPVVKPRQAGYKHYEIIAISNDNAVSETGELLTLESVGELIKTSGKQYCIVKQNVAEFVALLDDRYKGDPSWRWRASAKREEIWTPHMGVIRNEIEKTIITYFGWKTETQNNYHLALDPVVFYGKRIDDVCPGNDTRESKLLRWATGLREWCRKNNLALKPTNGALASQFLRDKRFYPNARRKVPTCINERARAELPGNYYSLHCGTHTNREYTAYYLDQKRAHHYHAQHTSLPDSNSLFAFGRFQSLGASVFPNVFTDFYGLYYLDLLPPQVPRSHPFYLFIGEYDKKQPFSAFVWSNEVTLLTDLGFTVQGVRAAWGSTKRDEGIPRYSKWAQGQLDQYNDAAWLKPILLCTYGMLAVSPSDMSFVYNTTKSKKGEPVTLVAGHRRLHGYLLSLTNGRKIDSKVANVLHRGMIEAATRTESLGLAHYLRYKDFRVLQIYADAVIVEDDGEQDLPLLPEPWRLHQHLNHYQPVHTQAFKSAQMVRLPGITGRERIKLSHGGHKNVPIKTRWDAITGARIPLEDYEKRNLTIKRI